MATKNGDARQGLFKMNSSASGMQDKWSSLEREGAKTWRERQQVEVQGQRQRCSSRRRESFGEGGEDAGVWCAPGDSLEGGWDVVGGREPTLGGRGREG